MRFGEGGVGEWIPDANIKNKNRNVCVVILFNKPMVKT